MGDNQAMKTGSFFITQDILGRVSIARFAPKGFGELPRFAALAPGGWFNSVERDEYCRRYAAQLAGLDPARVWQSLHEIIGGPEPMLLCWEQPGQFCHRRLVADWFLENLGKDVREFTVPNDTRQRGLFDELS